METISPAEALAAEELLDEIGGLGQVLRYVAPAPEAARKPAAGQERACGLEAAYRRTAQRYMADADAAVHRADQVVPEAQRVRANLQAEAARLRKVAADYEATADRWGKVCRGQ